MVKKLNAVMLRSTSKVIYLILNCRCWFTFSHFATRYWDLENC